MQLINSISSLVILALAANIKATYLSGEVSGAAAVADNQEFFLRVEPQEQGQTEGELIGLFQIKHTNRFRAVLSGSQDSGQKFTLSHGRLHTNMTLPSTGKEAKYSSTYTVYGEYIDFHPGSGKSDYLAFNKTDNRLSFDQSNTVAENENSFRICPYHGHQREGLAIGNTTNPHCRPVYLKMVEVK